MARFNFDRDTALALYAEGRSDTDIAAAVGVHLATIYEWRQSLGLVSNRRRKRLSYGRKGLYTVYLKATEELLVADKTVPEIAEYLGLSPSYVRDMTFRQRGRYEVIRTGTRDGRGVETFFDD